MLTSFDKYGNTVAGEIPDSGINEDKFIYDLEEKARAVIKKYENDIDTLVYELESLPKAEPNFSREFQREVVFGVLKEFPETFKKYNEWKN